MDYRLRARNIAGEDWDGIAELEAETYAASGLSEGEAALRSKCLVSPSTCFALDFGPKIVGYLIALPYPMGRYPDLNWIEEANHLSPNLHLHDLVISAGFRGRGLAKYLLHHLTSKAGSEGFEQISLIAVGGSAAFWSANGYRVNDGIAIPSGYGPDAVYMSKALHGGRRKRRSE